MAVIGNATAHQGYVYAELDAAAEETKTIKVAKVAVIHIADGGSFGGTIELHRKAPGEAAFTIVENGSWTDADLPVTKQVFEAHPEVQLKLVCSARSAGAADCSITTHRMDG